MLNIWRQSWLRKMRLPKRLRMMSIMRVIISFMIHQRAVPVSFTVAHLTRHRTDHLFALMTVVGIWLYPIRKMTLKSFLTGLMPKVGRSMADQQHQIGLEDGPHEAGSLHVGGNDQGTGA